jgi:hypothetical protein
MEKRLPLPKSINLEQLRENLDYLVASMSAYMCDCLVVCLSEENHNTGLILTVDTEDKTYNFRIEWTTKITPHLIGATRDEERTTEWAAMGIAVLLVRELTDYPYIYTRRKGEGIDFCLSKNDTIFSYDARLEVSGIRKESLKNTLKQRIAVKKRQTERSDVSNTPVFISITEFSKPKSILIKND